MRKYIFEIIICLIGLSLMLYSIIMQYILSFEKFGVYISHAIIPHYSLWFLLIGFIIFFIGLIIIVKRK